MQIRSCALILTKYCTFSAIALLSDVAICRLVTTRHTLVPNCWMSQYADWSQHVTHWYQTVGCCNMKTGHDTPHTGTQLSDVAICRLVTTHHTLVPNCQMRQYVDWSQHAHTSVPNSLFLVLHFHSTL